MRRLIAVCFSLMTFVGVGLLTAPATSAAGDSASGFGVDVDGNSFNFQATSGANPDGTMTVYFDSVEGVVTAPVECLTVVGNQAIMYGNFTDTTGNDLRVVGIVAEDNGFTSDRFRVVTATDWDIIPDHAYCTDPVFLNLEPIMSGQITIVADSDGDGVANSLDNCPALANLDQLNNDGDDLGDACDPDDDNDKVADAADPCPLVAEDLDTNQDADGCPEDPTHNLAVTTFRVPGGAAGDAPKSITIKIKNLGTHADTAYVQVIGSATYTGCSVATGPIAPGKTLTVSGCSVSYSTAGDYTHTVTAYHDSKDASDSAQYADDDLSNNTSSDTTRARK